MFLDERGRRPVAGRPAQARAGLRAAGVPPGLPRRDRRPAASRPASSTPTPARCCAHVDTTGVAEAGLKVVVDAAGGSAGLVLPSLLGRLGRRRAHRQHRPRRVPADGDGRDAGGPGWCGSASSSPPRGRPSACASTRSASGSRWSTSSGRIIEDDRALLVVLDLVAAERRSGRVALPVTTTRVAEQVAASTARRSSGPPPRRTT